MRKLLQEKGSVFKKIMSWILVMVILFTSADMSSFVVSAENQKSGLLSDGESDSGGGEILTDGSTEPPAEQPPAEQPQTEEPPVQDSVEGEKEAGYLTVKVFNDENKNGVWDEGETGIRDLDVSLSLQDTEEKMQIPASGDGVYAADGIQEGTYTVRLSAAPETVALYNLTESVFLSPDGNNIFYPNAEDTWFIGWNNIDVTKNHELVLGLQKDDLEKIEEEIGDGELLETEEGVFFSAEPETRATTANGFLKKEYIYYKGHKVDVWFDNGNSAGFSGCPSYRWIFRASDNKILYCIEPFVNGIDKGNYKGGGNMANAYGAEKARYMQLCAYYGADYAWPNAGSDWSVKALYFMAAQNLIWKQMGAKHLQWYQYKADYHGHFHPGYAINISYYENQIINKINNHSKMPSLPANQRIDHDYANPDKVYSFTDKNGALGNGWQSSSYNVEGWWIKSLPAGVNKAWIEGNQLKFTLKKDASIDGKQITFPLEKWFSSRGSNQYYVSTNPRQQSLMYQGSIANIPYNWSVTVNPTGQVKIQKVDDTGKAVPGVSFRWGTDKNNLNHTTGKTGSDGTVTIRANAGMIYVQENEVPSHLIKDETVKSVQIQSGKTASLTFTNQRVTRNVSIRKIETSTEDPIAGAKFQYWNEERPDTKYTVTTDSKGEFISSVKFPVGSQVTMEEIEAAPGYELPPENERKQTITVSLNESDNKFTFKNTVKKLPVRLKKINERTGDPIHGGVTFNIGPNLKDPEMYEELTTGSDGTVTTKEYPHGTKLFYQEIKAPSGFQVDDTVYSVIVDASTSSEVQTVIVRNEEAPISFSIKKKGDDGRPLAGVQFRLEKKIGNNWYTMHSNLVTDKNGKLNIPGTYDREMIINGRLRLVEEETVPGYNLLEEPFVFKEEHLDSEEAHAEVTITNKKIPTRLVIKKKDKDTDLPLSGAEFEITDENGKRIQLLKTDSSGQAETEELMADTVYYIEEITAPYGYKKLEGREKLKLDSSNNFQLERVYENEAYYGQIKLHKKDQTGKNLKGIEFTIYKGYTPVETLITNEDGYAESKRLPATDSYRIVETYAPPQYVSSGLDYSFRFLETNDGIVEQRENWTMTFHKNTLTATFDVTNKEIFGKVTIKKVDSEDKAVKVKGAKFELRNRYTGELIASGTTDESGSCTFENVPLVNPTVNSEQGYYYIEETSPGENHILPENTRKYFSLTVSRKELEVQFENPPFKGDIEITKVDKDDPSKKLEGAEFAIYRADNLDKVIYTAKTNGEGIARFDNLRYGDYVIKETKAPLYYRNDRVNGGNKEYWNEEIGGYCVTIKENGQVIPLTITNPRLQVRVKVIKYAEGKIATLGGAEFNLCKADGTVLETLVTSPVDGAVYSKNYYADELGEGAYLIETKAPAGYEPSTDKIFIKFDQNSENPILEIVKEVENRIKESEFKFQKVDEEGNGVDADFSIEVYNASRNIHWSYYYFDCWISTTKENTFADLSGFYNSFNNTLERHSENNLYDEYVLTFREVRADEWHQPVEGKLAELQYRLTSSGWTVKPYREGSLGPGVTFDYNTMTLTAVNKTIPVRLNVKKTDYHDNYLAGAVFRIIPVGQENKAVEVTSTGDANGVTVELPYAEEYIIREIQAPPGYFRERQDTTVKASQLSLISNETIWYYYGETSVGNNKQPEFTIKKIGSDQKPLGATFRITEVKNNMGLNQSITVSTQKEDGVVRVDLSPFSEFMNISYATGILKIEELSVEDSDYQMLAQPIYVEWETYRASWTFKTVVSGYDNPENVSFESKENVITITVPNKKKNYSFNMVKQGEPDDNERVWADIIISVNGSEYSKTISSDDLLNVDDIFSGLTDSNGYWIRIEEKDTTAGYEKVPVMGFRYYPDKKGLDKFQDANGPVSFEFDEQDSEKIIIKLTNTRSKMRLRFKKTNGSGTALAGAEFEITTQSPYFSKTYTTKGYPDGETVEFPYAQEIIVEEIKAPPGHIMGKQTKWTLTPNDFHSIDDINNSMYECDKLFTTPIVNESQYNLSIKKIDGDGQPANATFKIIGSGGVSGTWEVPTKEGAASLNFIVDDLLNRYPDWDRAELIITEIATDEGLLIQEGNLAKIIVDLYKIRSSYGSGYFQPSDYDGSSVWVDFDPRDMTTLEFTVRNEFIPVNLTLIKKEEGKENVYLAGAEFTITVHGGNSDGKQIKVETTGTSIGTTVKLPWAESYSVQETKAPEGYILDPTIYDYTLKDFQNQMDATGSILLAKNHSVTMTNTPITGKIQVKKVDEDNNKALAGAEFDIYKGSLNPGDTYENVQEPGYKKVGTITVDGSGIGVSAELSYGEYLLKETKAPSGYQITKEIYPIKVSRENETVYVQISNRKSEGTLNIVKVDEETSAPLAGAVFTVHRKDTNEQVGDRLVTGWDGKASMSLPYGEYYVKEVSFPSGYASASGKTYDFTLDGTHIEVTKNISNTKSKYALRLFKTDRETGEFLAGAVFGLYANDADPKTAEPIQKFTTNANGSAVVFLATGGHYDIYELQAPAGYQRLTEKFEVYVDDKVPTVEITVENTKQSLDIEIHKTDEADKPLAGAVFEIRNAKTGALVATTEPTGVTGKVTVQVPAGDYEYTVTEIQAPDGYVLDSTPRPVMINKGNQDGEIIYTAEPVELTNRQMKGNIKLVKVDGGSQKPLEGAVFGVYDNNDKLVDTLITNSKGEAMSKNLPNGRYTLKELTPPPGYEHSEMTYNAELTDTETLITITAENTSLKGGFTIRKADAQKSDKVLSGAVFRVYASYEEAANNGKYIAEKTTETNGLAVFENLSYGTYYVKETKAPEGYELNTRIFTVTVDGESAENLVLEVENHKKLEKGIFRVKKKDADTGIALKGAEFLVEGNSYSHTYPTGEDGTFETEELAPGTYTVTETKAPEGYRISKTPTRLVTVKAGDGIEASSPVVEYEFTNEKIQFPIRIVKTDDTSENKPLAGAVFELYRLNELGSHEGEALETLVTDINGEATSKMLPVGRYQVVEVNPPEGYKLSENPSQIVEITKDTPQETLEFTVIFRNSPELGSLKILKLALPNKEAEETQGNPLAGAEFEVTSASSGQTYKETTNSEGVAEFKNLPFGIYNVREVKVPAGYEDDSAYFGTVVIGKDAQQVVEITAYNYKKYGALSLKKTDCETGKLVAGATYGIYTKLADDGDIAPTSYLGKEYDLVTLPDQAYVTSKQLELGTYYVKEINSPPGYKRNPKVYEATLTDEIPVVQIDAEDEPYKGSVSIHKTDEHKNPLEGAVFALYTKEDYDKMQEELKPGEHAPDVPASYLTTDSQGNASKEDLVLGQTYVLIEFAAPAGYELQFEKQTFIPTAEKMHFTYQAVNKKKKELIIHKVNESGDPVSDVMFSVYRFGPDGRPETPDDGEAVAVLSPGITGDGIARMDISHLENGWYYVKETQGSEMGYEVSQEIITFEITDEKKEYEFTFVNYRPKGEIEIQKKDELGNPLPGAEFTLNIPGPDWYNGKNPNDLKEVAKFELDENGYGILKDIEASVYVIRETEAPAGYKPADDILVVMHRDGTEGIKNDRVYYYYHADIVNKPITGWISIQKQADLDDEPVTNMDLSNARFEIRDAKGELADTLITAKDGTAVSRELPVGIYTIKETQAPQGTILNEKEGTVSIDGTGENDIYTYTHVNQVVKGRLQIKKVDGDDSSQTLEGAEFDILKEDGTLVEHLVTGKDGIATSNYLPYGWYILRETKAPSGYALQIRDIRYLIQKEEQLLDIVVENMKSEDAEVLVVKYDKDNPTHYLKGAQFKLYGDKELSQQIGETFTTNDKGRIYFGKDLNLKRGKTYYLQETKAPDGYVLDETVHSFVLNPDEPQSIALYIANEMGKGYIRFDKTGDMLERMEEDDTYPNLKKLIWSEQTLMDAEIGIYAKTLVTLDGRTYQEGELLQRLKSGETSRALPLGTYQYKELSAPDGYILDENFHDIEVIENNVTEAEAALATLKNAHASVSLKLHKKFKDGNTPEKLEKVIFGVYTAYEIKENKVTIPAETLLGIIKINEKGQSIENHLKLPEGRYYVMELETADGYVLDGHKYPFTTGYQNEDRVIEISSAENPIVNEPVYGTIRVEKTGDMFTKVGKLVNQEGKYQVNRPVYGKGELKGAEFEIRAKDEVVVDGKTFKPGDVIDTLITGERDESIKLPLGTYILVETKAPEGYILDNEPREVTILPNEEPVKPSVAVHTMENEKAVPEIALYKSFFGKTQEEAAELYKEVLFGVYAQEEIRGVTNEAVLKADELVGLIRIDETGKGILKEDTVLPFGKYYVKELETAEGYQVSEEEYSFEVTKDNVGTGSVLIPGIAEDTPVVNLPEGAEIPFAFRKIGEDGQPLEGAVFRLYTCKEEHDHSQEAGTEGSCWKEVYGLSPKTSGEDGIVDFGILPDGTYQLKETEAPEGYVLPAGQWRFTVNSKAIPGEHITFTPTGGAQPPAFQKAEEGAVYQYQVMNRKARQMPFTGGTGMLDYAAGGGALLALAELVNRRRKKKNKGNVQ